jgi:YVTN family beta-propeller protein
MQRAKPNRFVTFALSAIVLGVTGPMVIAAPIAFVTGFGPNVSVVDLGTGTEVTTIPTGGGETYWIAKSASGNLIAATLHDSTGVVLIDPVTMTAIATVGGVGSEPEAVAIDAAGTTVYVADESGDALYVVDAASRTVTAGPIGLTGCSEPENMVLSPDDTTLWVTCTGDSVVKVATSGFAVTPVATGLSDPHGIALNPAGTRLYYTNGTDVLEYDTGLSALTGTTYAGCNQYNGTVSADGTRLYCVSEGSSLRVYQTSDGTLLQDVALGGFSARGVALHPDGSRAYVPLSSNSALVPAGFRPIVVVDTGTLAVTGVLQLAETTSPQPRSLVILGATTTTTTSTSSSTTTTLAGVVDSFFLPRRVLVKPNLKRPERSRLLTGGIFDTGSRSTDLAAGATLRVGGLTVVVPALTPEGGNFTLNQDGLAFRIRPALTRSSKTFFRLKLVRDLEGLVQTDGLLTLRFTNPTVDGGGTVKLAGGRYVLRRVPGALVAPNLYLFRVRARVNGGGRDALTLRVGLATDGMTPATPPDLRIGFGGTYSVTIPGSALSRRGDRFVSTGNPAVMLDYRREFLTLRARNIDLGAFPDGAQPLRVTVALGSESRVNDIRLVRTGAALKY